jgi:hypothetical protein
LWRFFFFSIFFSFLANWFPKHREFVTEYSLFLKKNSQNGESLWPNKNHCFFLLLLRLSSFFLLAKLKF